jgi:hypothetical protein
MQSVMPPYEIAGNEASEHGRAELNEAQKEEDLKSEKAIARS